MTIENEGRRARRFMYIDLLRFICASAVMIFHFGFVAPIPDHDLPISYAILPSLTLYGQFGVHIFFVISGFVIAMSIEGRSFSAFMWARFLRLYPAYWIAVASTAATLILTHSHRSPSWQQIAFNMTMLQSYFSVPDVDGVYNTLAVELRFYLMMALISAARFRPTSSAIIAIWLACCLASYALPPFFGKLVLAAWAPYFLAGMIIRNLLNREHFKIKAILLICAIALEWGIVSQHAARHNAGYDAKIGDAVVLAGTLSVYIFAIIPNLKRLIPTLTTLGAMTYPLYLIHAENGVALMRQTAPYLPSGLNIVMCLTLCLLLAYFVSDFLEPTFRNWIKARGERLIKHSAEFRTPSLES